MRILRSTMAALALAAALLAGTAAVNADATFSGKLAPYEDTYNGFKLMLPTEFQVGTKGATTDFNGPQVDGFATLVYINTVEMPGVPAKVLYDTNLQSKKQDRNYTDVKPLKVKSAVKGEVYAFTCSEANHAAGSPEEKKADDHHRWHLFVFGNGRFYTCGFTGSYAAFQAQQLQPTYTKIIQSFELIPTK